MNRRMVWLRRQEDVISKYHRVLQTHIDPCFVLTEGARQFHNHPEEDKGEGGIHVKEMRKDTWQGRGHEALHLRSGMKRLIGCSDYWREQEKISMRTYRRA
jgi:hypothetical protein